MADSSSTTSSSSSSSSYSSSSFSSMTTDECANKGKCYARLKNFKGQICPKSIRTYNLNTCLISYKPRLLRVPSKRYPDIDSALVRLKERKGGYVIRLCPGTHNVTQNLCVNVDRLHILGDCNPFAGVGYVNGCSLRNINILELCANNCLPCGTTTGLPPEYGEGPFQITFTGRRIIVTGTVSPNFSLVPRGTIITVVRRDGTTAQAEVVCGNANMLTLTGDVTISGMGGYTGEGFAFNPNVVLTGGANWQVSEKLIIQGVAFHGGIWVLGTHGLYFDLRNSMGSPDSVIYIIGIYRFPFPNTFLGEVVVDAPSMGVAYFQVFLSSTGRLNVNGSCSSAWRACHFASCRGATRIVNGASVDFANSSWTNNCLALAILNGSNATVHNTEFCGNRFGIMAIYMSVATSYPIRDLRQFEQPPILRNNYIAITANYNCYVLISQATLINNTYTAMIDTKLHKSPESIPVGSLGHENSLVLLTVNSINVGESDTNCVNGATTPNSSGRYLNIKGLHGLVDYSPVKNGVTFNENPSTTPSLTEQLAALGSQTTSNNVSGIDVTNPNLISGVGITNAIATTPTPAVTGSVFI